MTPPPKRRPIGSAVYFGLAAAVIAVVAWQAGRSTERNAARRSESTPPAATAPTRAPDSGMAAPPAFPQDAESAAPEVTEPPPAPVESEATFEMPVVPHPTEAMPYHAPEERPADTPERCIMVQAYPSMAAAYGRTGEVVQLVVRAQNGCSTNFGSASFRVIAIGPQGEVGSATGRFPGGVRGGGSAETLVAIPTKPGTSLSFRAEISGY